MIVLALLLVVLAALVVLLVAVIVRGMTNPEGMNDDPRLRPYEPEEDEVGG